MRNGIKRAFGVVAVATVSVLVAGSAIAVAGPGKHRVAKHLVRAGVHADVSLIKADGTTDAFTMDRGKVTASSSSALTLLRKDGKSVTLGINGSTVVRGQVQVDKPALVFSRAGTAFRIRAPRAPGAAPALPAAPAGEKQSHSGVVHADVTRIKADGSTVSVTMDRGEVTASSSSSVTLLRKDGKSVTLGLNGDTKIRGKLAVGGNAVVFSRGGTAFAVLARGPKS